MNSNINKNFVCKNNQCDIMTYLTSYITPIMQVLSVHLPDYHMKLRTTKCLNTSIMTMYLLLGNKGIKYSEHCNVSKVKDRIIKNNITREDEMVLFDKMLNNLLKKGGKHRYFYYIMITDGEMLCPKNSQYNNSPIDKTDYFPGHVFVIEKVPCGKENTYKIYQSYINQYTLKGHFMKNHNSMQISEADLKAIFGNTGIDPNTKLINKNKQRQGVSTIFINNTWDENVTKAWEKLTYVPSKKYNGFSTNNLKFCYQKVKVNSCYKILLEFVNNAIKNIKKNPEFYTLNEPADPQLQSQELLDKLLKLKSEVTEKYYKINAQNNM